MSSKYKKYKRNSFFDYSYNIALRTWGIIIGSIIISVMSIILLSLIVAELCNNNIISTIVMIIGIVIGFYMLITSVYEYGRY